MKRTTLLILFFTATLSLAQSKVKKLIEKGDFEKFEAYLDEGGDINQTVYQIDALGEEAEYSLLIFSVGSGCKECVEILIDRKDQIDDFERDLAESFAFSLSRKNDEISNLLFQLVPNAKGVCDICHGNNTLMVAATYGREEWYFKLKPDSDLSYINNGGATLMHAAASGESEKILADVIATSGLNINAKDNEGLTPLDYAASNEDLASAYPMLIKNGADPALAWNLLHWYSVFNVDIPKKDLELHKSKVWDRDEEDYNAIMNFSIYHYNYVEDVSAGKLLEKISIIIDFMIEEFDDKKATDIFNEYYYQERITQGILDALYYAADDEFEFPIYQNYLKLLGMALKVSEYDTLTKKDYKLAAKFYGKEFINQWYDLHDIPIP